MDKKININKYETIIRNNCVLCGNKIIKSYEINKMPSFVGVVDCDVDSGDSVIQDMVIGKCANCGLYQNIKLLPTDLVYLNNHNIDVVGDLWNNHYLEFSKFILKNSNIKNIILEVGDPSAKIAKLISENYNKWYIMEPNSNIKNFKNIIIINDFFNTNIDFTPDLIIHSHVLEHMYSPMDFLKKSNLILPENGQLIFSIPNMKWMIDNKSLPINILNFEHTYYIGTDYIERFLNLSGFELEEIYIYKNHSIFIKAKKAEDIKKYKDINREDINLGDLISYYNDKIKNINDYLGEKDYYLYSAHINSQYMLASGISRNIKCLLDSSSSKIDKRLYGYDYDIKSPMCIKYEKNPIVVLSHMGVYYNEIKEKLESINKNVIIL